MGEVFAARYELADPIGRGGVGAVWRAWDHRRRRYVAAKVLQQSDAHALLRFVREQALRIDHPHVLAPASWAADDDKVLFTMDLVTGGSLVHLVGDYGPLPPAFVCVLVDQLLSGLAAVHAEGVVHRDIKPANILLEATGTGRPRLRLSDFGIAMRLGEPRLTETNLVVGTPGYLAPEQMLGAEPDFPADLFAVGLVALYLLEGAKPDAKALVQHFAEHGTPGAPQSVPEPLWQVVATLLQPDPQARFRSATGARKALASAAELLPEPGPDDEQIEIFDQIGPLPKGFGPRGPSRPAAGVAGPNGVAAGPGGFAVGPGGVAAVPGEGEVPSDGPPGDGGSRGGGEGGGAGAWPTGTPSPYERSPYERPGPARNVADPSGHADPAGPATDDVPGADPHWAWPGTGSRTSGQAVAPARPDTPPPPPVPARPPHPGGEPGSGAFPGDPRRPAVPGAPPSAPPAPAQDPTPEPSMSDTGSFHLPPPGSTGTAFLGTAPPPARPPAPVPPPPAHLPTATATPTPTPATTPQRSVLPHEGTFALPLRPQAGGTAHLTDPSTASYTTQDPPSPTTQAPPSPVPIQHPQQTAGAPGAAGRSRRRGRRRAPVPRRPGPPVVVALPLLLLALACYAVGFWALARI